MEYNGGSGKIQDFFFKGRVTGPKGLYNIISTKKCVGIVTSEKGLAEQSKLGDQGGLKNMWLDMYNQGHWNGVTSSESRSVSVQSIKSLKAVAVSRIGESTPVELRKAYNMESVENGLIPRESVFVIDEIQTKVNRNVRTNYSDNIKAKFNKLVMTCAEDSAEDMLFKPIIITVND